MRRQIDPHGIVHDMEAGAASRHGAAD